MPLYTYKCPKENKEYDMFKKLTDVDTQAFCPTCGQPGEKIIKPVGFRISGAGVSNPGYRHPDIQKKGS